MKTWFYSVVFLFISGLLFCQNDPHISLSKVTPDGGVAYSQITSIIEDSKGFIWFSTNNGLFSYNTINIKRYNYSQKDTTTLSTNRINALFNDHLGVMWVATENGLCSYNAKGDNFNRHEIKDNFNREIGKNIISFFQDQHNDYWISDENGLGTFNPRTNRVLYLNINNKTEDVNFLTIDPNHTIWVFYDDGEIYYKTKDSNIFKFFKKSFAGDISSVLFDNNLMWIGYSQKGLLSLNILDGSIAHYFDSDLNKNGVLSGYQVRSLIKDDANNIWVATDKGIVIIDDFKIKLVIDQQKYPNLPHNSIWSLYKDSNNSIWIGTWLGGLCFHNKYNNSFQHHSQTRSRKSLSSNIISCFAQIPNSSKILVGTDVDDLNLYGPETNIFTPTPIIHKGKTIKRIKSVTYDKFGTLWVGTYRNGILFKKRTNQFFERLTPPFEIGLQALNILATNEGIWVSNFPLGVYFYNFESKSYTNYRHNPLDKNSISNNNVNHIIEDRNNNLWFATEKGLNLLKKGSSEFIRYSIDRIDPNSISHNFINHIHEDHNGDLWLGTNGEGLNKFNPKTGNSEAISLNADSAGNEIFSILQDEFKNLWVTSDNGLYKFNIQSTLIEYFESNKGIKNNNFYPTAALKSVDGELYFGGSNGFIRFQPNTIIPNPIPPSTIITELFINNEKIIPETENGILKTPISNTKSLKLNYKQNSFSFLFTSNNYINPEKNNFKYRLKNFDNNWIETSYNGQAGYTNIPTGNYIFEVKASNNNGIWNETPTRIAIQITPPIWLTWYAYLFYILIAITTLYIFRKQATNRQKLKLKLKMSRIRSEAEEKLHQMKLQFFTDISHEFRTPLTLIQGPVNRLLKTEPKTDLTRKQLALIKNNTDRLLSLINQFLDFRRIDQGKLKLSPIHTDIVLFCKNVFNCFEEHATQRLFNYNFITEFTSLKMDFDADKLDKILVNILSNAFKYSADQGSITLKIKTNKKTEIKKNWSFYTIGNEILENFIEISITDSGHGISSENLPKLFERFFQIEDSKYKSVNGTGIGLSLSTNYINIHNGQLIVSSLKGVGTVFYIYLPIHQANTFKEQTNKPVELKTSDYNFETTFYNSSQVKNDKITDNQESLILIAEDNPDLLEFLEESLSNHFRIAKAKNGKEALDLTMSLYPDLIISDIMMPIVDGIELCKNIKSDIRTSHIPVVLLTALSAIQDKVSGMKSGADAYVPKPFNEEFLIAQVNNLLSSRKMLRALFASKQDVWNEDADFLNIDKKLIQKAINNVEKNISNCDYTVEDLAKNLNLSRTHLHRKLKSLTNQSATEFIRNIRLKRAVDLMKSGDYLINEIGFAVGFNSHNYFTKAFKKQYGKSPRDFIKDNL